MIGHDALEFVPPEWHPTMTDYMRAEREDPYEAEVVHKNGRRIPVELVGKTVFLDGEAHRLGALLACSLADSWAPPWS